MKISSRNGLIPSVVWPLMEACGEGLSKGHPGDGLVDLISQTVWYPTRSIVRAVCKFLIIPFYAYTEV